MAEFVSSESRERHQMLDGTLERFHELIDMPLMAEMFDEHTLKTAKFVLGLLEVANVRDGVVSLPDGKACMNAIPLVAMRPGETVRLDPDLTFPAPLQFLRLTEQFREWSLEDMAYGDAQLTKILDDIERQSTKIPLDIAMKQKTLGFVTAAGSEGYFDTNDRQRMPLAPQCFEVKSRPIMALRFSTEPAAPITVGHEIVHVAQIMYDTIRPRPVTGTAEYAVAVERDRLAAELEAYHFGAKVGEMLQVNGELQEADKGNWHRHLLIDHVRRQGANPNEPFRPTAKILGDLHVMKLAV